eukprot:CAMPEP_0197318148 /NCGR_PEP_ID=MMETSP0891-20130614/49670_1 /TAXON_ID=44058 ORGANISM="Aureoumbra lagunensis, Strain CCMP1510" /NCGR_SAMPLE_ID=MMETSP0891 /ASSEMBLY_ACC=CAM_ASM_000534 /LENGTH=40 /DNA_ID= /DNA_START= /DNA_END= /DNA_ORIENTATION=
MGSYQFGFPNNGATIAGKDSYAKRGILGNNGAAYATKDRA